MQTTLFGLAIALILALLAALVGPYFVNWNDHRAFFEAEASRLIGLNVRVNGPIKVGILPFPSVALGDIEIGPAGEASRLRARSLGIELGLGPLMRGEIRAVEMRLVGPQFSIGLNSLGRVDWPAMALQTETLAIDRLSIEDGRAMLTDAASNSRLVLDKLWFGGEVRSLTGPFRGEGAFVTPAASTATDFGRPAGATTASHQAQRRDRRAADGDRGRRHARRSNAARRGSTARWRCRGRPARCWRAARRWLTSRGG